MTRASSASPSLLDRSNGSATRNFIWTRNLRLDNLLRLRFGMRRASLNVDLYNALNGNAVLQQSNAFGNWQQPQASWSGAR